MFWERFSELCYSNNVSANAVCAKLGLSTATATHWKNGTMPKGDVLVKIADYFDVSVDYLLMRVDSPRLTKEKRKNTMDNNFDIKKLSSAQRAMLKYYLFNMLVIHYGDDCFLSRKEYKQLLNNDEELLKKPLTWFKLPQDYSYDAKNIVPKIFKELGTDVKSLFSGSLLVITNNAAKMLELENGNDEKRFVDAYELFSKLSKLTLKSVYELDRGLYSQITFDNQLPDAFADTMGRHSLVNEVNTLVSAAKNNV